MMVASVFNGRIDSECLAPQTETTRPSAEYARES
jgi:hypothetical protein